MVRERDESGQFVETMDADTMLALFEEVEGPVIGTADVADAFDCTTEHAGRRLAELAEAGVLGRRQVGRQYVYWQEEGDE